MLHGLAIFSGQRLLLILDKTDANELDKQNSKPTDGIQDFQRAQATKDDKEKETALKDVVDKNEGKPIAVAASAALMQVTAKTADKAEDVKAAGDRAIKIASAYRPHKEP